MYQQLMQFPNSPVPVVMPQLLNVWNGGMQQGALPTGNVQVFPALQPAEMPALQGMANETTGGWRNGSPEPSQCSESSESSNSVEQMSTVSEPPSLPGYKDHGLVPMKLPQFPSGLVPVDLVDMSPIS